VASSVSAVSADADSVIFHSLLEAFLAAPVLDLLLLLTTVQPSLDGAYALRSSFALSPPCKESSSAASLSEALPDLVAARAFAGSLSSFTSVSAVKPSLDSANAFGLSLALGPPPQ